MDTQLSVPTGKIALFIGPHAAQDSLLELAGGLVHLGRVRVLDGGNQFNAYLLARSLRRRSAEIFSLLDSITLARAFTCYQMETMLAESRDIAAPTIVLDLLGTFFDENVPLPERKRLLTRCTAHLFRLSRRAPLAVGARPADPSSERGELLAILREAVDLVWEVGLPPSRPQQPSQLALF
jgi:hypothetical protein